MTKWIWSSGASGEAVGETWAEFEDALRAEPETDPAYQYKVIVHRRFFGARRLYRMVSWSQVVW